MQLLVTQPVAGDPLPVMQISETPIDNQLQTDKGYAIGNETGRNSLCYAWVPPRNRRVQITLIGWINNETVLPSKMPVFLVINGKLEIAVANVELATLPSPICWVKGTKTMFHLVSSLCFAQLTARP